MKKILFILLLLLPICAFSQTQNFDYVQYKKMKHTSGGFLNDSAICYVVQNEASQGLAGIRFISETDTVYIFLKNKLLTVNSDTFNLDLLGDSIYFFVNDDTVRITTAKPLKINNLVIPTGSEVWLINGSDIYYDAGNVGIGTSTPADELEVIGTASADIINSNDSIFQVNGVAFLQVGKGNSIFCGVDAGAVDDETNNYNTFIGHQSGYSNTSGYNNTFIGHQSGYSNTSGHGNFFFGEKAGYLNISGNKNLFLGVSAGCSSTSSHFNTFIGYQSGYSIKTGCYNTGIGYKSNLSNQTSYGNTIIGYEAGKNNVGGYNTFLGFLAGYNETGSNKLYIENSNSANPLIYGDFSTDYLKFNCDSVRNTGNQYNDSTFSHHFGGLSNFTIGKSDEIATFGAFPITPSSAPTADYQVSNKKYVDDNFTNVSFGTSGQIPYMNAGDTDFIYDADFTFANNKLTIDTLNIDDDVLQFSGSDFISKKNSSICLGVNAGYNDDNTDNTNIFIGEESGENTSSGYGNVFVGYRSGRTNTTGVNNVCIGVNAGTGYNTMYNNVLIGWSAGTYSHKFNTIIGYNAGHTNQSNYNIFLGYKAGYYETGSNKLYIDVQQYENEANARDSSVIQADFSDRTVKLGEGVGLIQEESEIHFEKITIISDSILVAYTRPQELIAAPGAGKIIKVISIMGFLDYNSVAYTPQINIHIKYGTVANEKILYKNSILSKTADAYCDYNLEKQQSYMLVNSALMFTIQDGNTADGDSPLHFYITYQIITL